MAMNLQFFVDESYLQGLTFFTCEENENSTVHLLQSLGPPSKSSPGLNTRNLIPSFRFKLCGNKIKLTDCKSDRIILELKKLLYEEKQTSICHRSLVATFPALSYGNLYYRELERCKISSLKFNAP